MTRKYDKKKNLYMDETRIADNSGKTIKNVISEQSQNRFKFIVTEQCFSS
jgi:hypothetical protein